ncbi:MAG: 3-methyl-2-oxobutanoate hydroxymethyltransferase [Candidatus Zixiibacteriota bacterium]
MKKKTTAPKIKAFKGKRPITSLTAYDYYTAKYLEEAGIDFILVGDSISMVVYGYETTLDATMEMMCMHTDAVSRGAKNTLVVGDLPFMSYQSSVEKAIENAGKLIMAGAGAVKLEGGLEFAITAERIIRAGIPVLGHIGMQPQSIHAVGGYKTAGKTEESEKYLIESAKALEDAGCFGIVLEKVSSEASKKITETINIPTIGIGCGNTTDGQILVVNDILGLYDEFTPPFVKKYANLKENILTAVKEYISDVKEGNYPLR